MRDGIETFLSYQSQNGLSLLFPSIFCATEKCFKARRLEALLPRLTTPNQLTVNQLMANQQPPIIIPPVRANQNTGSSITLVRVVLLPAMAVVVVEVEARMVVGL